MLTPHAAAIGTGPEDFAFVIADNHGAGLQYDGWQIGAGSSHHLRGQRLVAAADQHDGVHRLRPNHLLDVHRHQVAKHEARG